MEKQAVRLNIIQDVYKQDAADVIDGIEQMNIFHEELIINTVNQCARKEELLAIRTSVRRLKNATAQENLDQRARKEELIAIRTSVRRLENATAQENLDLIVRRIVNGSLEPERADLRELKSQLATLQLRVKPLHK